MEVDFNQLAEKDRLIRGYLGDTLNLYEEMAFSEQLKKDPNLQLIVEMEKNPEKFEKIKASYQRKDGIDFNMMVFYAIGIATPEEKEKIETALKTDEWLRLELEAIHAEFVDLDVREGIVRINPLEPDGPLTGDHHIFGKDLG